MKFKIGDRVGSAEDAVKFNMHEAPEFGEVSDVTTKGLVLVKWDNEWKNRNAKPLEEKLLMLEADILAKNSVLEKEFEKVEKKIIAKMQKAADAVDEAAELAKEAGLELQDMYDAYRPLYNAMDKAGWNTSSFSC